MVDHFRYFRHPADSGSRLEELAGGRNTDPAIERHLVGYDVVGTRMDTRAIDAIEGTLKARAAELLHLVVSHNGRLEWGAPRRPKSLGAVGLHHLNNLDPQVDCTRLLADSALSNGDPWTRYDRLAGRSIYSGNRTSSSAEEEGRPRRSATRAPGGGNGEPLQEVEA